MDTIQGRVIRARSGFYDVQRGDLLLRCRLRGSLKRRQRSEEGRRLYADPVAVGDEVIFAQIDDEEGIIEDILPRRTKLSRRYPVTRRDQRIEQIVVANADQIVIVISTRLPDFNLRFLDRFLISLNDDRFLLNDFNQLILTSKFPTAMPIIMPDKSKTK